MKLKLKTAHNLGNFFELFGLAIILTSTFVGSDERGTAVAVGGFVLAMIGFAIHAFLCRCPYCKGRLVKRGFNLPDTCPSCGRKLEK